MSAARLLTVSSFRHSTSFLSNLVDSSSLDAYSTWIKSVSRLNAYINQSRQIRTIISNEQRNKSGRKDQEASIYLILHDGASVEEGVEELTRFCANEFIHG